MNNYYYYHFKFHLFQFAEAELSKEGSPAKRPNVVLPKILDGTFFKVVVFFNHPNIRAECQTCGKKCSAAINGTGNLTKHYRLIHPTLVDNLLTHIQKKAENEANCVKKILKRVI